MHVKEEDIILFDSNTTVIHDNSKHRIEPGCQKTLKSTTLATQTLKRKLLKTN